jgi:hypothetical protein
VYDQDPKNENKSYRYKSRMFLTLPHETEKMGNELMATVEQSRYESGQFIRVHQLILNELVKRFSYVQMPDSILVNIQAHLAVDLLSYDVDSVRKLILQTEALFVFSMMKSVLLSQARDPFIKGMLQKYQVDDNSPALHSYETRWREKSSLEGLVHFNMRGAKRDLDAVSVLLMNDSFISLPRLLNEKTQGTLEKQSMFSFPFDARLLRSHGAKWGFADFKGLKVQDIEAKVNHFPINHAKLVVAQKIKSMHFNHVAKYQWVEAISKEIRGHIEVEFDLPPGGPSEEQEIDQQLQRLLSMIKQYMQTVTFESFAKGLRDFTTFLLSFILRDADMWQTKVVKELQYNQWLPLRLSKPLANSNLINDLELIPLRSSPMVKVRADIEDVVKPGASQLKRQKIVTSP